MRSGGSAVLLNEDAVPAIAAAVSAVGLDRIVGFEDSDPQLLYVSSPADALGGPGPAALCALLAALISYKLAMKGEEWWACYRDHMMGVGRVEGLEGAVEAVSGFVTSCRGAVIGREAKLMRLRKVTSARGSLEGLLEDPRTAIFDRYRDLVLSVASALGQDPWDKTIVFSLKMAYYAYRGYSADRRPLPSWPEIPIDTRISCMSYSSTLVNAQGDPVHAVMSRPEVARRGWRMVADAAGVPPLHVDSVLWAIGQLPGALPFEEAISAADRILSPLGPASRDLVRVLIGRPCPRRVSSRRPR